MRILIVGAGSTGGYFGARLAQAGRDVTFLARRARAAALRASGLRVLSPLGDFAVVPRLVEAAALAETFDVVPVTVKAFGLAAAIGDFAPAVGPGTMILPGPAGAVPQGPRALPAPARHLRQRDPRRPGRRRAGGGRCSGAWRLCRRRSASRSRATCRTRRRRNDSDG